jgi:tetratricopeptide (TPR) repeat protein
MGRAPRFLRILAGAAEHQQAGRYAEAERDYRRVLAEQPANVAALNNLAVTQQALGRAKEAIANYRRAIAVAPKDARLRVNLGNALLDQQMDAEAIAAYRYALMLQPGMAEVHNDLGGLLQKSGDLRGSAECYQQAIALNPELPEAYGNLARIRLAQGSGYGPAALSAALRYLALRPCQDAQKLFARCIQNAWPRRPVGDLRAILRRALSEAWDRPLNLSAVTAHLICVDFLERCDGSNHLAVLIHGIAGIRWRVSHNTLIVFKDWVSRPTYSSNHVSHTRHVGQYAAAVQFPSRRAQENHGCVRRWTHYL